MSKIFITIVILLSCYSLPAQVCYRHNLTKIESEKLIKAPNCITENPNLASPCISENGREFILLKTTDNRYTWMDVTVENGEPFNYKQGLYGKGNQLKADVEDFPHFAKTGVHSTEELANTKTVTGISAAKITVDARPWGSSGVGFVAADETIMSVIWGDNQTVEKLGFTHPDIARPVFHFWNLMHDFNRYNLDTKTNTRFELASIVYNGYEIESKVQGSRGWQESIFNDEILGTGHIELWRQLNASEIKFLDKHYNHLLPEQLQQLKKELSYLHTGEMVLFYINRYGFYEGHNEYRVDPVTVAFLFGLKPIEEIHRAVNGDLYSYFTAHFTENPE
ncbi:hypothetical protein [uncultured Draconibacterium sp.]|uniref:hypothetical protein n=1 Tax=uncultured Draconibacterium sp. TaxID=1573823 RepID=UPI002AA60D41|nr:hypothetical protein [uncultured Draconibacterium sp.]